MNGLIAPQDNCEPVDETMQYEPELSEEDNPHYYHSNQMLFYAHMARQHRLPPHTEHWLIFR